MFWKRPEARFLPISRSTDTQDAAIHAINTALEKVSNQSAFAIDLTELVTAVARLEATLPAELVTAAHKEATGFISDEYKAPLDYFPVTEAGFAYPIVSLDNLKNSTVAEISGSLSKFRNIMEFLGEFSIDGEKIPKN